MSMKVVYSRHFFLKCMYQTIESDRHVFVC